MHYQAQKYIKIYHFRRIDSIYKKEDNDNKKEIGNVQVHRVTLIIKHMKKKMFY